MGWRRSGDKLLSEPMMFSLLRHICVNRPQWINWSGYHLSHTEYGTVFQYHDDRQNERLCADHISKRILLHEYNMNVFRFTFHWNSFLMVQLMISQCWCSWWIGTEQITSHRAVHTQRSSRQPHTHAKKGKKYTKTKQNKKTWNVLFRLRFLVCDQVISVKKRIFKHTIFWLMSR